MKLITLNVWGGRVIDPFTAFIKKHANDVDIFCFQEVFHEAEQWMRTDTDNAHLDLFNEIQKLLHDHIGYFCPTVEGYYGIATFIKKSYVIKASGDILIHKNDSIDESGGHHDRKLLWLDLEIDNRPLSILNVHGLWNGKGKTDTPERIIQSNKIRDFMDSVKGERILCGDFNLLPDTQSLAILAKGMQNLVKEYKVTSTRTSLYTRAATSGVFADYVFASPNIQVIDFKVLPDEVSDHAALFMEFKVV